MMSLLVIYVETTQGNGFYDGKNVLNEPTVFEPWEVRDCVKVLSELIGLGKITSFEIFEG